MLPAKGILVVNVSVRNIPDEDAVELKRIAKRNNRSVEAEIRHAIANLVRSNAARGLGTRLQRQYGGIIDDDFQFARDQTPPKPIEFE